MLRFALISLLLLTSCSKKDDLSNAPVAAKIPHEMKIEKIGEVLHDDYAWLRDKDWPSKVQDEKILDYINAENKYTELFFEAEKENEEKLFSELKGRIQLSDQSAYIKRDEYYYYTRTEEGKSYPIYCRKHGSMAGPEEVILDVNKIAEGKKFAKVDEVSVSPDHKILAYNVDFVGDERYMIKLLNLDRREYLADLVLDTRGKIVWHEKLNGFFYLALNKETRPDTVMFHEIGASIASDKTIFHESNNPYWAWIENTNSREFAVIYSATHGDTEAHIVSLKDPELKPILVKARQLDITYEVNHNGDYIYILTNDAGPNMRLMRSKIADLAINNWKEYIPLDHQKYLHSFDLTVNYLILNYKNQGLPSVKILHLDDSIAKVVTFPDSAFTAMAYSTNFVENDLRVDYSSLIKPETKYSYDFATAKLSILKQQEVLGGYKEDEYAVERIWVNNEGVSIPISLYYKKSLFKQDGSNPLYLYAYGAYGMSIPPRFYTTTLSLVDRGFVFAIAHVRGGDDLGYEWYEQARLLNKKKTFEDFIACADFLVKKQYTSENNIVISGGSAGGTLVGAAANMRPNLYKAVVATHPMVDALNSLLDESLRLTPTGYKEWGNPNEKEYFDYIKSYSPYDNVGKHNYPNMFVVNGLSDPRVGYFEAAKWVAKLRSHKTNDSIILLKTNMESGHFGASDRFEWLKEYAEQYAFIFKVFGIKPFAEAKK